MKTLSWDRFEAIPFVGEFKPLELNGARCDEFLQFVQETLAHPQDLLHGGADDFVALLLPVHRLVRI